MRKRRALTPFGLAFLDVMCCGFGAVVLLVMILNSQILERREAKGADLREALDRSQALREFARQDLAENRREAERLELEEGELQRRVEQLRQSISAEKSEAEKAAARVREIDRSLAEIEKENRALAEKAKKTAEEKEGAAETGNKLAGFSGDGQRQYLTGLKLGGKRTLVLLDASASMLDERLVDIIRRKLMPPAARRQAPKWIRAIRAFHWVVANLPPENEFQVYRFNTEAAPILPGSGDKWLSSGDAAQLASAIDGARQIAPEGGTSLENAFEVIRKLRPRPDSVILITDGLPTQGASARNKGNVSAEDRQELFDDALDRLPEGVPVNTLLLPNEGDPTAAETFWSLAILTRGSFITPTRDWP